MCIAAACADDREQSRLNGYVPELDRFYRGVVIRGVYLITDDGALLIFSDLILQCKSKIPDPSDTHALSYDWLKTTKVLPRSNAIVLNVQIDRSIAVGFYDRRIVNVGNTPRHSDFCEQQVNVNIA